MILSKEDIEQHKILCKDNKTRLAEYQSHEELRAQRDKAVELLRPEMVDEVLARKIEEFLEAVEQGS